VVSGEWAVGGGATNRNVSRAAGVGIRTMERMHPLPVEIQAIPEFCRRWKVKQFSLIGSVLRPDFGPTSDVDVVITFEAGATWDLFDIVKMRDELTAIFGRPVDIIEEPAVRNPYMLDSIRRTKRVLYAA
jgi:uncharacterized protein